MLPIVTGRRLPTRKQLHVIGASVSPWSSIPAGMKYMFATECSNPAANERGDGKDDAEDLVRRRARREPSQTARQTSALQKTPRATASPKSREHLALAIASAVAATLPFPSEWTPVRPIPTAVADAPTRLPAYTTAQLRAARPSSGAESPGHHDERVAGEELRASDEDEDEPEGEDDTDEQTRGGP